MPYSVLMNTQQENYNKSYPAFTNLFVALFLEGMLLCSSKEYWNLRRID